MTEARRTSCDAKSSCKIIGSSKQSSLPLQRSPPCLDESVERQSDNHGNVQPVDMLVPVGFGHGRVSDVLFLGVVGLVSIGLRALSDGSGL